MYLFDVKILKRHHDWKRVAVGLGLGYVLGAYATDIDHGRLVERAKLNREIILAHEKKYVNTVLNHTGFGSNYIGSKDFSEVAQAKKPY